MNKYSCILCRFWEKAYFGHDKSKKRCKISYLHRFAIRGPINTVQTPFANAFSPLVGCVCLGLSNQERDWTSYFCSPTLSQTARDPVPARSERHSPFAGRQKWLKVYKKRKKDSKQILGKQSLFIHFSAHIIVSQFCSLWEELFWLEHGDPPHQPTTTRFSTAVAGGLAVATKAKCTAG